MRVSDKFGLFLEGMRDDRGEVYVEYAVLGALAVLVILGAIQFFFGGLAQLFTNIGEMLRSLG